MYKHFVMRDNDQNHVVWADGAFHAHILARAAVRDGADVARVCVVDPAMRLGFRIIQEVRGE